MAVGEGHGRLVGPVRFLGECHLQNDLAHRRNHEALQSSGPFEGPISANREGKFFFENPGDSIS